MLNSHRLTFPCAFHPTQMISQFCQCKDCMLPLCKQCLPIHQKQHSTMPSSPNIIDIGYLVDRVSNDIHSQREVLQKKSVMLGKLQKSAEQIHKSTLKRLEGDRSDTIKLVNSKFDQMSKMLLAGYQERIYYIKHILEKIDTLDKTLEITNSTLFKAKPMRTIIMWQSQQLQNHGLQFQVKLEKQILAPYKVQLLNVEPSKLDDVLNILTTDRLIQSNCEFQSEYSNGYFQVLSKILESDIDIKVHSAKRKSTRMEKNHSEQRDKASGDIKCKKIIEVMGSLQNIGERKWANRTGKIFQMRQNFD